MNRQGTGLSAEPSSVADLTNRIRSPAPLEVDLRGLRRGLDNYHVDVELSTAFALHVATVTEEQVSRVVSGKRLLTGNSEPLDDLRAKYLDLMVDPAPVQDRSFARETPRPSVRAREVCPATGAREA